MMYDVMTSWCSKTTVLVRPHVTDKPLCMESVVEKMRLQSPFHRIREDGRRNRRIKKNKQKLRLQTRTEYVRTMSKKGVEVKHDTKLVPIIHLYKTKQTTIRKTTYLPRKSVEKGVKELRRNKTHIL